MSKPYKQGIARANVWPPNKKCSCELRKQGIVRAIVWLHSRTKGKRLCVNWYEGRERTKLYGQRVKAIIGTYHFTTVVIVLEPAVWPLTNLLVAEIQIDYPSIANNCEQADAHYVSCVLVYQTLEDSRPTKMRQRS